MQPHAAPGRPHNAGHLNRGVARPGDADIEASAFAHLDALLAVSGEVDTTSILARFLKSACELTHSASGALVILGVDRQPSKCLTHGTDTAGLLADGTLPEGGLHTSIRVRGTPLGELRLSGRRDRAPFTCRDTVLVQGLASVAGLLIENSQSYRRSERRRRWLKMFAELNEVLQPPITLTEAFARISDAVRIASQSAAALVVQVPEIGEPVISAVVGEAFDLTREERETFNDAVRSVVRTGRIVEVPIRDRVAVIVALRAHLTMPGVIITHHRARDVAEVVEERELLASFANHAALALDRTQALEEREEMAVVSDRDRIARDLHDVVIQRLFATGLHMQSIRSAATTPELKERIDQSVRDLDQTIRDIRGTIFELQTRPQNSLRTEVRDLVHEYVPVLGFTPSVETQGPVDSSLEPNLQQQLVAVLREALSNVARHSGAVAAAVELRVTETHLRLRVTDDGKGIPDERDESGLRNARRRAILLGGSLDLWPNEPRGTSFIWSVPLPPDAGAARSQ